MLFASMGCQVIEIKNWGQTFTYLHVSPKIKNNHNFEFKLENLFFCMRRLILKKNKYLY